jgi:hypothetical protein
MDVLEFKTTPIEGVYELGKIKREPLKELYNDNILEPPPINNLIKLVEFIGDKAKPIIACWHWGNVWGTTISGNNDTTIWHRDVSPHNYMLTMGASKSPDHGTWFGECGIKYSPNLHFNMDDNQISKKWQSDVWTAYLIHIKTWHHAPITPLETQRYFFRYYFHMKTDLKTLLEGESK